MARPLQFPDANAPAGSPPNYRPESWAVRMMAPLPSGKMWAEWRKHPTRVAAELSIAQLRFPRWAHDVPITFETWTWIDTSYEWYLDKTSTFLNGDPI